MTFMTTYTTQTPPPPAESPSAAAELDSYVREVVAYTLTGEAPQAILARHYDTAAALLREAIAELKQPPTVGVRPHVSLRVRPYVECSRNNGGMVSCREFVDVSIA